MSDNATALLFDMRAPSFGAPAERLYSAALEMATFADEMGISRIGLMEHHGSDDGYLPSPFVMGGSVAARTKRCRINLGAIILPLHDPVHVAEQIAVLDLLSAGRLQVIFAAGYVPSEFALFKASLHDRGKLLDQGIDIILRALHGERFSTDGREVFVRPLPIQKPEAILFGGGGVESVGAPRREIRYRLCADASRSVRSVRRGVPQAWPRARAKNGGNPAAEHPCRRRSGGRLGSSIAARPARRAGIREVGRGRAQFELSLQVAHQRGSPTQFWDVRGLDARGGPRASADDMGYRRRAEFYAVAGRVVPRRGLEKSRTAETQSDAAHRPTRTAAQDMKESER